MAHDGRDPDEDTEVGDALAAAAEPSDAETGCTWCDPEDPGPPEDVVLMGEVPRHPPSGLPRDLEDALDEAWARTKQLIGQILAVGWQQ